MIVKVESYGQVVVLNCRGELTADSVEALQRSADKQLDDPQVRDLVLNLEDVPFVDSAALECLLELQERLSERLGQVKLARPHQNAWKIFEITGLANAFEKFEDVSEAVKAI